MAAVRLCSSGFTGDENAASLYQDTGKLYLSGFNHEHATGCPMYRPLSGDAGSTSLDSRKLAGSRWINYQNFCPRMMKIFPKWRAQQGWITPQQKIRHMAGSSPKWPIELASMGQTIAEWAIYILIILCIISLSKKVPYHLFRYIHKISR